VRNLEKLEVEGRSECRQSLFFLLLSAFGEKPSLETPGIIDLKRLLDGKPGKRRRIL